MDGLFLATVQSVEESIINALIAAETMVGVNGNKALAIDHQELRKRCENMAGSTGEPLWDKSYGGFSQSRSESRNRPGYRCVIIGIRSTRDVGQRRP